MVTLGGTPRRKNYRRKFGQATVPSCMLNFKPFFPRIDLLLLSGRRL